MHAFTDSAGRTWELAVNCHTCKRVKGLTGHNLFDPQAATILADDPIELCNVLYALAKDQCERQGVTDADFGRALAGDSLADATAALMEELIDFFPPARRALLRAMRTQTVTQEKITNLLAELLKTQSTDAPASSESTPALSPSAA